MGRWHVEKIDGVWQAFDPDGRLRYAADDWWTAYSFARLAVPAPKKRRPPLTEIYRGYFGDL